MANWSSDGIHSISDDHQVLLLFVMWWPRNNMAKYIISTKAYVFQSTTAKIINFSRETLIVSFFFQNLLRRLKSICLWLPLQYANVTCSLVLNSSQDIKYFEERSYESVFIFNYTSLLNLTQNWLFRWYQTDRTIHTTTGCLKDL